MLKGIAICAMLWHHLFTTAEYGNFVLFLGGLGKVCVAIFLFASGYGLYVQYNKLNLSPTKEGVKVGVIFLVKRFVKFYVNYWVVFIIFVPIGVFVFGRTLNQPYGESVNLFKHFIFDVLGVQGFHSYNITWWFNKLIILLYLLFPLLFFLIKRLPWMTLLGLLVVLRFGNHFDLLNANIELSVWLFPFALGMFWASKTDILNVLSQKLNKYLFLSISVVFLLGFVWIRTHNIIPHWSATRIDGFLTLSIALFVITYIRNTKYLNMILTYFGKHSINIYMVHTFIFYYWFKGFISSFQHPVVQFLVLLFVCLIISTTLEFVKTKCGIYKLQNQLISRFNQ
ncbi:MAG: acyltransferase family protein [Paludibacter sp.]|nr:acyltransferase family protein [Paludibacter sp.]